MAKILGAVLFVEGHGAAQAGADATGHALLQRDIAGHAPLLRQGCHRFEHGGRAAGHDAVEVLLLAQVRHQAVVAVGAVVGGDESFGASGLEVLLQNHGVLIAEAQHRDGLLPQLGSHTQQGRHADAAAHQQGALALVHGEAVAQGG